MLEHMKFKGPANATYVEQVQIGQLSDTATTKSLCLTQIVLRDHTSIVFNMYIYNIYVYIHVHTRNYIVCIYYIDTHTHTLGN